MAETNFLDRMVDSVLGRILIAALQTILLSQTLLLAFVARGIVEPLLLKYTILVAVGILAGFSARRLLKGRTRALQTLTALAASALSLGLLSLISSGFLGLNLFSPGGSRPDWQGLLHYGISSLGALLVISAFRPRGRSEDLPQAAPPAREVMLQPPGEGQHPLPRLSAPASRQSAAGAAKVALQEAAPPPRAKRAARGSASARTRKKSSPKKSGAAKRSAANPPARKVNQPARARKKSHHLEIKFIGEQEHICPYCLEPVQEHDPRGVKICPICKTRHHADCWGITGACQIPHLHEKS